MMIVDTCMNQIFDNIAHLRWHNFPKIALCEAYYSYYYAENRLYVIRDAMTDQLFFVKADSPKEAFLKFNQRMNDAISAGEYVGREDTWR